MKKKQRKVLVGIAITGGLIWWLSQKNKATVIKPPTQATQYTAQNTKTNTTRSAIGQVYHSAL